MARKKGYFLAVQYIRIYWLKKHRSAQYATLREKYNKEFALPKGYFNQDVNYGIPIHTVIIKQSDNGINIVKNTIRLNKYDDMIRLGGVDILIGGDKPEIVYRYTPQLCGAPTRHDKKYNFLCEKAFDLNEGESGRVINNGRHSDVDTGEWYYTMDIVNVCLTSEYSEEIFLEKTFDKCYEQLAILK